MGMVVFPSAAVLISFSGHNSVICRSRAFQLWNESSGRLSQVKIVCLAVRSENGFREGILKGRGWSLCSDLKEEMGKACFTNYTIVSLCLLLVRFVSWGFVKARPLLHPKESCGTCGKPNVVLVMCDSFVSILFSFNRPFRQFYFLLTLIEGKEAMMTQDSFSATTGFPSMVPSRYFGSVIPLTIISLAEDVIPHQRVPCSGELAYCMSLFASSNLKEKPNALLALNVNSVARFSPNSFEYIQYVNC